MRIRMNGTQCQGDGRIAPAAPATDNALMSTDILIIGAGPAGAAAGILLARADFSVTLLEAQCHPRHHIGESLLPGSIPILNKLGISSETLAMHYQPKFGGSFL